MSAGAFFKAVTPIAKAIADDVVSAAGKPAAEAVKRTPWGWRGAKPGELSGTEYTDTVDKWLRKGDVTAPLPAKITKQDKRWLKSTNEGKMNNVFQHMFDYAWFSNNISKGRWGDVLVPGQRVGADSAGYIIANKFRTLERAGIPREYTGKVLRAMEKSDVSLNSNVWPKGTYGWGDWEVDNPTRISAILRDLESDSLRDEFLQLLPEWEDTPEALATMIRMI